MASYNKFQPLKKTRLAALLLILSTTALAEVKVSSVSTGMGTYASPWVGWETALINPSAHTQYNFSCDGAGAPGLCYFDFVNSPNWMKPGIALVGEAGVVLRHRGIGNAIVFDDATSWTFNVRMENFIVQGNAGTTNGILARGLRRGNFKNISVRDVTEAGMRCEACVTNIIDNFGVSAYEQPFLIRPKYGLVLDQRSTNAADGTTTTTVSNIVIEGTGLIGIWVKGSSYGNTFINGTSEGNIGKGMVIDSWQNTVINMDLEGNGATDLTLWGLRNSLINVFSMREVRIDCCAQNRITGGRFNNIYIAPGVHMTTLEGMELTGTLQDLDDKASTIRIGNIFPSGLGGYQFGARFPNVITNVATLQHGTVVNTDCTINSNFQFVAYENFTLATPTRAFNGQRVTWRIAQGNAGGWLITYGSRFWRKAGAATLPVLSTAPGAYDYITAVYNSSRDSWDIQ